MSVIVRPISKNDDQALAKIIRTSLTEFGVPKIGTVYSDPTTDQLSALFETAGSSYFVAEEDGILIGGCGIYPTPGLPASCAELVKLYLTKDFRGKGLGKLLMDKCFDSATSLGYNQLYLESFPQLEKAVSMYLKAGFYRLPGPLGDSGHHACTIWMMKELAGGGQ